MEDSKDEFSKILISVPIDGFIYEEKLDDFECFEKEINDFLKKEALDIDRENIAKTTLFVDNENNDIVGFYTLNTGQITLEANQQIVGAVRKEMDTYSTLNISYFAINKKYQRLGYGRKIMLELFSNALSIQQHCGFSFIFLEALYTSTEFYEAMGFGFLSNKYYNDEASGNYSCKYDMFIKSDQIIKMWFEELTKDFSKTIKISGSR